jgi:hypothetical protein
MITLLINDTWKLRFEKSQKLCYIFRHQCYVAEDCVNPPDDSVINVCVLQFMPPKSNVLSTSPDFHQCSDHNQQYKEKISKSVLICHFT